MKALFAVLTAFWLVTPAQAQYSGGSGRADDPYQIATAADLIALGNTPDDYDKHFVLTADIDLDPNLPGGQIFDQAVIPRFSGAFDGDGHEISHLTIVGDNDLGLFGGLGPKAAVSELGVTRIEISGSGGAVGGLAGSNHGHVIRCHSGGWIRGAVMVGGLVGSNQGGRVRRCWSRVSVDGESALGGLAGFNDGGDVTHCHATGSVSGEGAVGGLVGDNEQGTIAYCYSSGSVSGHGGIGGLVGGNWAGSVTYCYSTGSVSGSQEVGGRVIL